MAIIIAYVMTVIVKIYWSTLLVIDTISSVITIVAAIIIMIVISTVLSSASSLVMTIIINWTLILDVVTIMSLAIAIVVTISQATIGLPTRFATIFGIVMIVRCICFVFSTSDVLLASLWQILEISRGLSCCRAGIKDVLEFIPCWINCLVSLYIQLSQIYYEHCYIAIHLKN